MGGRQANISSISDNALSGTADTSDSARNDILPNDDEDVEVGETHSACGVMIHDEDDTTVSCCCCCSSGCVVIVLVLLLLLRCRCVWFSKLCIEEEEANVCVLCALSFFSWSPPQKQRTDDDTR